MIVTSVANYARQKKNYYLGFVVYLKWKYYYLFQSSAGIKKEKLFETNLK